MAFKHVYVMELEVHFGRNSETENITIQFSNNGGHDSVDIAFQSEDYDINGHGVTLSCGSTLEPETKEASSLEVCVASPANIQTPFTLSRHEDETHLFTYLTAMYTSLEEDEDVKSQTMQGYEEVSKLSSSLLHRYHVESWDTLWASGIEVVSDTRSDVAVAVNASLFAILSSVREDWAYGLAPGGLTNYYNGHSFWDTEVMSHRVMMLRPAVRHIYNDY